MPLVGFYRSRACGGDKHAPPLPRRASPETGLRASVSSKPNVGVSELAVGFPPRRESRWWESHGGAGNKGLIPQDAAEDMRFLKINSIFYELSKYVLCSYLYFFTRHTMRTNFRSTPLSSVHSTTERLLTFERLTWFNFPKKALKCDSYWLRYLCSTLFVKCNVVMRNI